MEFCCSVCNYSSTNKDNVTRHMNRKTSCGSGDKKLIEIPIEIKCKICNKNFSCTRSLRNHIDNTCKKPKALSKIETLEQKVIYLEKQLELSELKKQLDHQKNIKKKYK
jgi:hypothetical protein